MNGYDENGVKRRFDGKGTEFGLMHRDLGPGYLMFDLDRMSAVVELDLELRREEEGWIEYRHHEGRVHFTALFEVKRQKTVYSEKALDSNESSSMARNEIARRLECRLFVVFATNGTQPFEFWEFNKTSDDYFWLGILSYKQECRKDAVQKFWRDVLKIEKCPAAVRSRN